MERAAFARARSFLNYHPVAKWSALVAGVGGKKKSKRRYEDDEEEEPPRKKKRRYQDEDEEEERPRSNRF